MKLTSFTDYCLRVLMYLSLKERGFSTIAEIADRYDISRNHLVKVVHELGRLGYVETVRGRSGGVRLRITPREINLGTLVREAESEFSLVECFASGSDCRLTPSCRLRGVFHEALDAFLWVLDRYTLADLLEPRQDLARLLAIDIPVRAEQSGD